MAEIQPPGIVEGATTGDIEDEIPQAASSAEDRKAAAALSSLDAPREDNSAAATKNVDQEAVRKAMDRLAGAGVTKTEEKKAEAKKDVKKAVKLDQEDVKLIIEELDLSKIRATELLKANEGDAVKAMRAFITV